MFSLPAESARSVKAEELVDIYRHMPVELLQEKMLQNCS